MNNRINGTTLEEPGTTTTTIDGSARNAGESNPLDGRSPNSGRFNIGGDTIASACTNLPDDQRHALKWAAGYCRERNINCNEFGALLTKGDDGKPYSGDSVYAAFTGRREGSLDRLCTAIHAFRKRIQETAPRTSTPFIETSLSQAIFSACRAAFLRHRVVFIFGESQIGKTTAAQEYARLNNHGESILVRMPTGGSLTQFTAELAIRLGISRQNPAADLRRRIIESFDERTLLIVDECEQCLSRTTDRPLASLEFAREIHDRRKCGLVLIGALSFRNALKTSYSLRKLWLRGYRPLQLPDRPTKENLDLFSESFGLDPAPDKNIKIDTTILTQDSRLKTQDSIIGNPLQVQTAVIKDYGLGRWLTILEDAADNAKANGGRITWGRVIVAHHQLRAIESGEAI
jgi:hypothetical protein